MRCDDDDDNDDDDDDADDADDDDGGDDNDDDGKPMLGDLVVVRGHRVLTHTQLFLS